MENLISIKNLTYRYSDGTQALKGVNLDVRRGEKLAVLGANGSGKSTLFLCLNGVLRASGGEIFFEDQPLKYDAKSLIHIRKNVGIVFQDPETQLFCVNVYQEVAFGPNNLKLKKEELARCVEESMEQVDVSQFANKPPHFLSGGQKKRGSIAAVLSMKPQVLIFDEPTAALDPIHAKQVLHLMQDLNENGITIMMSTHDVDLAYSWADRIVVMHDGVVEKEDTPYHIFSDRQALARWELSIPQVLCVFNKLRECGLVGEETPAPANMAQLEQCIERISRR